MPRSCTFSLPGQDFTLDQLDHPLDLDQLLPGSGEWEVELGFGKGRFLLRSALENPDRRFLGIELVSKYYRLLLDRSRRRGLHNLAVVRGEALYLLATVLPKGFASRLHVYFPDPWHKAKHNKRRMFDPETLDLMLGLLRPDGELLFASDYLEYGDLVIEMLENHPNLDVEQIHEPWPDGARTNYEAKFMREGRPIRRLRARRKPQPAPLGDVHPRGEAGILAAWAKSE